MGTGAGTGMGAGTGVGSCDCFYSLVVFVVCCLLTVV